MDPEITRRVIEEMAEDYNAIFRGVAFVKDEYARTRAANGLMVELCKMKDYIKTVKEKTGAAAPTAQKSDDVATSSPQSPSAPEVAPAKPAEPGQQTLAEAPESIPSPGTKPTAGGEPFATEKQVNAIRKFCETPRLKGFVAETLRTIGKGSAGQLSISEASDLIGKLYDMKGGIPVGAKVDTTGART
jgi:hypothetical protein